MSAPGVSVPWPRRIGLCIMLLVCGLLVFVLGSNYYSVFPTNDSQAYRAILAAALLGTAILLRRNDSSRPYSDIAYAFFVATMGYFVTSLTAGFRDSLLGVESGPMQTPRDLALIKLFESLLVVSVIVLLTLLWGADLRSLYIRKGRLGLSLFVGLSLLTINTATGITTGAALGHAGEELVARLPWAMLFSLANGFMEEVWFRGLFLRRFSSVVGIAGSIVVTSAVFTVSHAAASYMNLVEAILFQVILFPMALLFAYLMHKSDNVWGAMLYHAGSDVFLFYLMLA
jgi:membrane protease YdiL (CAAX protease family)